MALITIVLFIESLECAAIRGSISAGDNDRSRLLTEGPPAWAALSQFYSHLEGKVTITGEALNSPNAGRLSGARVMKRVQFRFNGKMGLTLTFPMANAGSNATEDRGSYVHGMNSRYAFKINRSTTTDPYTVTYYGPRSPDFYSVELVQTEMANHLLRAFCVNGMSLDKFLAQSGLSIDKVGPVTEGPSMAWIRMEFSWLYHEKDPKGQESPSTSLFQGWIDFDPQNHWCVRRYLLQWPGAGGKKRGHNDSTIIEYGQPIDGFPIVQRVTSVTYSNDRTTESRTVSELEEMVHRTIPERDFTLSAFGLPEVDPELGIEKGGYLWVWLVVLSLLTAVAAVAFAKLARKRA
jgi:hypothetical protein